MTDLEFAIAVMVGLILCRLISTAVECAIAWKQMARAKACEADVEPRPAGTANYKDDPFHWAPWRGLR